jgi:antitoxin (DNA-binding transcriptional repressor) of toxin-antitoxin stability system
MSVMTVTDFRWHPQDAMSHVEAGEIIEITRHNRTIAELRPRRGAGDVE